MIKKAKTLLIIPAYNEEDNIFSTLQNVKSLKDMPFDIVVLNDKSTDSTLKICNQHSIKVLSQKKKQGIDKITQKGYQYAKKEGYDIVVRIDADGQHNPEHIKKVIKPLLNNKADLVIGSRFKEKQGDQSTFIRRLGIRLIRLLIKQASGFEITDPTCGFKACNKQGIDVFCNHTPTPDSLVFFADKKLRVCEIPIIVDKRQAGKSDFTPIKSLLFMVKVISMLLRKIF